MTFAQLSARLKNFFNGWLLVLGLKEGLVQCATVCVKSVVILQIIPKSFKSHPKIISKLSLSHLCNQKSFQNYDCPLREQQANNLWQNLQNLFCAWPRNPEKNL